MKSLLTVLILAGMIMAASCSGDAPKVAEKQAAQTVASEKVILQVEGMTCENCVKAVNKALENCEGVIEHQVSLAESAAVVAFDPAKINPEKIIAAIEKVGYKAKMPATE